MMSKRKTDLSYFNILAKIYLLTSLSLIFNFFGALWGGTHLNTLFLELVYTLVNWVFSLFVLYWTADFFQKVRQGNFQKVTSVSIRLKPLNLVALMLWITLTIACFLHSTQGLFFRDFLDNIFLSTSFLNELLIVQFSVSIYLLFFMGIFFCLTLALKKSKNLKIHVVKYNNYPLEKVVGVKDTIREIEDRNTQLMTLAFAIHFRKNLTWNRNFSLLLIGLKINALKTEALRLTKKETTPPLIFSC